MRGGYQIIYFGGKNLTVGGSAVTIAGVYETLEGNYGKPIVISGMSIGGSERADVWANFYVSGSNFISKVQGIGTITVTAADAVTITAFS